MQHNKGKSITTSVPSIAIRFNATAEEIEELYTKNDADDADDNSTSSNPNSANNANNASDPESSPLRTYLRLGKRSTSVDVSPIGSSQDASPPTDSWKFFSEIKSKITKSVEGKITEYKSKKELDMDTGSSTSKTKDAKETKENPNPSESDDEESSISKTCGIISTSDGVELSSDDETPSTSEDMLRPILKQKRAKGLLDKKTSFAADVFLEDEVESAVEAVEDLFKGDLVSSTGEKWDDFHEVDKEEFRSTFYEDTNQRFVSLHPPEFVDLRARLAEPVDWLRMLKRYLIIMLAIIGTKFWFNIPDYMCGFISGSFATTTLFTFYLIYRKFHELFYGKPVVQITKICEEEEPAIYNVPPVEEYTPIMKFEGWVNEYPEAYNPHTYHISNTQSVYLKLKGNYLRISHTRSKIPKRALFNEPAFHVPLTHHRIYNLLGSKIHLLPDGLAKGKRWSKKYPICIVLDKEHADVIIKKTQHDAEEDNSQTINTNVRMSNIKSDDEGSINENGKEEVEESSEAENDDELELSKALDEEDEEKVSDTLFNIEVTNSVNKQEDLGGKPIKLFLFGRTDREKEMWFRRLSCSTHRGAHYSTSKLKSRRCSASFTLIRGAREMESYKKTMVFLQAEVPYMSFYEFLRKHEDCELFFSNQEFSKELFDSLSKDIAPDVKWVNCFVGRILHDCIKNPDFIDKVKERIQKKLSAIKLPYFIEDLLITELNLGNDIPLVHNISNPLVDDRGLWLDFEITYSGLVTLILNTKLNLLKIKNKNLEATLEEHIDDRSHPMYNSDVDDTAESSTDDEYVKYPPALDSSGYPLQGLGGSSNASKKFIKIVDKVAESKIFQAAAENKFIKKAIENVSNTDLGLRVEVRALVGTLVVNIPPPPSDRIWSSFRPLPKLQLLAMPIVGERNITHLRVTNFIEKKLIQEFQKIFVLPNMEDVCLPIMSSKLPD